MYRQLKIQKAKCRGKFGSDIWYTNPFFDFSGDKGPISIHPLSYIRNCSFFS